MYIYNITQFEANVQDRQTATFGVHWPTKYPTPTEITLGRLGSGGSGSLKLRSGGMNSSLCGIHLNSRITKAWSLTCSTNSLNHDTIWKLGYSTKLLVGMTLFGYLQKNSQQYSTVTCWVFMTSHGMLGFQRNCGDPAAMPSFTARVRQAAAGMRLVRPIASHCAWKPSHLKVSWNRSTPNHPKFDHLCIETHGFGVPSF
jgi:hypothetical protein